MYKAPHSLQSTLNRKLKDMDRKIYEYLQTSGVLHPICVRFALFVFIYFNEHTYILFIDDKVSHRLHRESISEIYEKLHR